MSSFFTDRFSNLVPYTPGEQPKDNQYLKLSLCTETGASMDALCFSSATEFEKYLDEKYGEGTFEAVLFGRTSGVKLDLTYYPSINEFRGTKTIQIIVDKYR